MKKILLLALIVVYATIAFADVQIGDGSETGLGLPMEPYYGYSYSQVIYHQGEIQTDGTITAIEYEAESPEGFGPVDVVVYMGHTALTEFATDTSWIPVDDLTTVYNGQITVPAGGGIITIELDAAFEYNNVDNLVIGFEENTDGYNSGSDEFYGTNVELARAIEYHSDSTNPDPADPPAASYGNPKSAIANVNLVGITAEVVPSMPQSPVPADMATGVTQNVSFAWTSNFTDSWDLYLDGTMVAEGLLAAEYSHDEVLTYSSEHSWYVVAHNAFGSTTSDTWTFTVMDDPTITELPHLENFDTVAEGDLPAGWSSIINSTAGLANVDVYSGYNSAYSDPNNLRLTNSSDTEATLLAITPQVISDDARVRFMAKLSYGTSSLIVGTITDPTDPATFNQLSVIDLTTDYTEYSVPFNTTGMQYIAFKHGVEETYRNIYIDDVNFEEVPAGAPLAANLVAPANEAINIAANVDLTWAADGGGANPTGYNLYFGTDNPPSNMVNGVDQGDVTSYQATGLDYSTTYYWSVEAYNATDTADMSEVFSFTVMDDPTISDFPYTEDFVEYLPLNWSETTGLLAETVELSGTSSAWGDDDFANAGEMTSAKLNIYGTSRDEWLMTPPIDLGDGSTEYRLEFDLALTPWNGTTESTLGEDDKFAVVISTDNGATWSSNNTLQLWDNTSEIGLNDHVIIPLTDYSGTVKIGFYGESTVSNADNDLFVTNVTIQEPPSAPIPAVNPTELAFAMTEVDYQSADMEVTVSNAGTGTFNVNSVALAGTDADQFIITDENSYPAEVGEDNLMITVAFAPTTGGDKSATLEITDSLSREVHVVNLTGSAFVLDTELPWAEDFMSWPPIGWDLAGGTHTTSQYVDEESEVYAAEASFWSWPTGSDAYMITPEIEITGIASGSYEFSFDWSHTYSATYPNDEMVVSISNDAGQTWTELWGLAGEEFESNDGAGNTAPGSFVTEEIDISEYAGDTVHLKFYFLSGYGPDVFLDNVAIGEGGGTTPDAPAVFFSEYIEGSSNNKAMEIFNNSGETIDLTNFRINQSNNGGDWQYIHEFPAESTLAHGEVWVIMTDQVDPELYAAADADEVLGYPSVVHYNGNDARALEYSIDGETWVMLDVIGIPTSDADWDVAGVTEATGEHTLVRKDAVTEGNTDWAASAGTNADDSEWVVYDQDTFEYLGWHGQQQEDPGFISGNVTLSDEGDVTQATVTAGEITVNPDASGDYMIEIPAGTYSVVAALEGYATATVTGVVVESAVATENVDFALELSSEQAAPENVSVDEITGTMSWFPPAGQGEDTWLQWCEEINNDGIGMTGGGTFSVASRWDTENIALYNGMTLSKISFYPNGTTGRSTFVLKVWVGDNAENLSMVMEQEVTPTMDQWNEIDLDNPVTIDGTQELWFGYTVVDQADGEFPAGTDAGPAVTGFGDMISMNGSTWDALSDLAPDLNYNWNIKGYVQNPTGRTMPMVVLEEKHFNNSRKSSVGDLAQANLNKASSAVKRTTREFLGYNVYLDGEIVAESISELNYQFSELTVGEEYVGAVSAIYDEGESDLIEVPFTFAGILDVPTDLAVDETTGVVTWGDPGPGGPGGAVLEEGFEGGTLPTGWMTIDNDGDGHDWVNTLEPDGFGFDAHTGEGAMTSASYINAGGPLTPDNYLITPQLSLGSGAELTYWVAAQDAAWAAEYYEVKVSTSGTAAADFADVVFSETLSTDAWQEVTVDLSAYAGEDIYLAWNHTDVTDMFYMKIDDVAVTDANTRDFTGAYNVYKNGVLVGDAVTEQTFTLTALLVGSEYTVGVTAIHDAGESTAAELTFEFVGEEQILPIDDLAVDENSGELSWSEPAPAIDYSDDFEAYTAGDYLAEVSDMWTTWAQNPGGSDDALISDAVANSGTNSVHVEGTSDLVLPLGNKTSGTYEFSMMMYLEPGNGGYYNIQHDQTPGVEWGAEFYFGDDGNGEYNAGYPETQNFTHPTGEWFEVKNVIDLDAAEGTFYVNETLVATWDFGLTAQGEPGVNQLGGINIYSGAITGQTPNFYFDDVNIFKVTGRPVLSYDVYLDDTLVGNTTETNFMLEDLTNGQEYTAGVVAVYEGGDSEMAEVTFTYTGTFADEDLVLTTALKGNYPNPFNPTTTISFSLAEAANVNLKVYNAKGQVVKTLVAGEMTADNHTVVWNGDDNSGKAVSSGVYFYRMSTKGFSSTQKMMLIK